MASFYESAFASNLTRSQAPAWNNSKTIEAKHWTQTFEIADELQLDTPHTSENYNKLNSYIDDHNYHQRELNDELVNLDLDKQKLNIANKLYELSNKQTKNIDIQSLLHKIGYDIVDGTLIQQSYDMISQDELEKIYDDIDIPSPLDNFVSTKDSFSFIDTNLNDLQFELLDGNLTITTYDKDLDPQRAKELSQSITIPNFDTWDTEHTNLQLNNGTKVNLQNLLETIGVVDGGGIVDVKTASKELLSNDETLQQYIDQANITVGTNKSDTIRTGHQDDLIVSLDGDDTIYSGGGDDIIIGGTGADTIYGADGTDTVSYENSKGSVQVNLDTGTGNYGDASGDTLHDIENLKGSSYADILQGDDKHNVLYGGAGDDILRGGDGADTIYGGDGIDIADYIYNNEAVDINLSNDFNSDGDKLYDIEGISGTVFDDTLVGDSQANIFYGNQGDDRISSRGGDDMVYGGAGDDYIKGGYGDDQLFGGGDNIILKIFNINLKPHSNKNFRIINAQ